MTNDSELNPKNYKRISIINWLLCLPLMMLLAWPYIYLTEFMGIKKFMAYPGAAFFALPFMITILHGHVTMAVGEAHRHHYYQWLNKKPFSYGLLFHPLMMRTRFRLTLLALALLLFITGYIISM